MRIKKITAKNLAEGKQLVKDNLGEEAVILSTRTVKDKENNSERLEIVAAIDNKNDINRSEPKNYNSNSLTNKQNKNDSTIESIISKITYPLLEYLDNNSQEVYKELIEIGYNDKFSMEVIKELSQQIDSELKLDDAINLIASKIKNTNLLEKKLAQKIYGFIGPSGTGKTTTLLKYASIHKLMHSSKILVINTNNYNFGDKDILKIQSEYLGLDYKSISKNDDLNDVLIKSKGYDLILIDNFGDTYSLPNKVECILTIPTTYSTTYIRECLLSYNFKYISFTFTDKSMNLQSIINLMLENDSELVFYTNGGDIPDDFEVLDKSSILKFLVKNVK